MISSPVITSEPADEPSPRLLSPRTIMRNAKLSLAARVLYWHLVDDADERGVASLPAKTLADRLGITTAYVSELSRELREKGIISVQRRGAKPPRYKLLGIAAAIAAMGAFSPASSASARTISPSSSERIGISDTELITASSGGGPNPPFDNGESNSSTTRALFEVAGATQESVIPSPQTPHPGRQSSPRLGGLDLSRSAAAASNGARAREDAVLLLLLNGLKSYGIDEATARDLLASHDVDAIRDQLRSMPHHLADHARRGTAIQKPGAYLRRAIVERFAPHRKAVAEQRAETLAAISTRAIATELEERATAEMLAMLPAELREDLERRAQAELERNPVVRRAGDEVRRRFIEGCVARLAREAQMGAAS